MINKILIANRGEIACRIIKTAKKLGLETVAIYSEIDKNTLHTKLADEAFLVGPASSKESYLNREKIIAIAKKAKVDTIHPGYGFLAENPQFAKDCTAANIIFIGPTAAAIETMGSKSQAKAIMEQAQIPVVPGYHGDDQNPKLLLAEAKKIGFPILLKPVAGGGGKGMRVVESQQEFNLALTAAKREALNSFADDKVLVEKYLMNPRHIEIQIFADTQGNIVHLFERDCSIQRRHQKIIEEAPAPGLSVDLRLRIATAAINVAKAIAYTGAGTVEFLLDENQNFYFMEMNTRLQVEHPVTEMITGLDLVEWQIKIADGEPLPLTQKQISFHGHAIEVRIYAEDPEVNFLPAIGEIQCLRQPKEDTYVRIDNGIILGDKISPYYDPMLAKIITWGNDRQHALNNLSQALNHYYLIGVKNNISYLQKIINSEPFKNALINTHFIQTYQQELRIKPVEEIEPYLATVCLYALFLQQNKAQTTITSSLPWELADGFRINLCDQQVLYLSYGQQRVKCAVIFTGDHYEITIHGKHYRCEGHFQKNSTFIILNDAKLKLEVIKINHEFHVFHKGKHLVIQQFDPVLYYEKQPEISQGMNAPMPGTITAILTKVGRNVAKGDKLLILEAMKMEHVIQAPMDGIVKEIYYEVGDMVDEGAELLSFEIA